MILRSLLTILSLSSATQIPFQAPVQQPGPVDFWSLLDSPSASSSPQPGTLRSFPPLRTRKQKISRPRNLNLTTYHALRKARWRSRVALRTSEPFAIVNALSREREVWEEWDGWEDEEVVVPDTSDWDTLKGLAMMTGNAYWEHPPVNGTIPPGWYDLGEGWEVRESFGWSLPNMRGHIFATPDNSTVVMAIKGTSAGIVGGGGDTGSNDKFNDNLLFSCCCARVDWTWTPVCDCYRKGGDGYQCSGDCVETAVMEEGSYYPAATELFNNITARYADSQLWIVGHSLGGGLGALLAITFGIPAVTFEAPGDLLAARRLHLPLPPPKTIANESLPFPLPSFPKGMEGVIDWLRWSEKADEDDQLGNGDYGYAPVTHVYHNADPIPMGVCTGVLSSCALAGFALESRCHTGKTILFDTVSKLGWSVDIRTHPISQVITKVLDPETWRDKELLSSAAHERDGGNEEDREAMGKWRWPWKGKKDKGEGEDEEKKDPLVPEAEPELDCQDCFRWNYQQPEER
ncbi:alpha/beta-hydrolase [Atractiella rhizophila]|nr:alpha/beta-hydrolase [Atractiella rhizophila]